MEAAFVRKNMQAALPPSRSFAWRKPPGKIVLESGQVHIWRIELQNTFSSETSNVLSAHELQRALRLISPLKRARFQSARAALRRILSLYSHQSPESVRFSYGPEGKPYINLSGNADKLEFNISHSGNLMLAAFTTCGPVGIDLESSQSISAKERIVAQYFTAGDLRAYRAIPEEEKQDAFLSAWVQKEAYGKALGSGLAAAPARDHFSKSARSVLPAGQCAALAEPKGCCLRFTPLTGFTAALVVNSEEKPHFNFWEFVNITQKNKLDRFFK